MVQVVRLKRPKLKLITVKKQEVSDGKPTDTLPTNTILYLLKKKKNAVMKRRKT